MPGRKELAIRAKWSRHEVEFTHDSRHVSVPVPLILTLIVNTLLYPYSRFVYERAVGFIVGENVFFVNAIFMLFVKAMTMAICWSLSILIAPIGLLYLYIHHSRRALT